MNKFCRRFCHDSDWKLLISINLGKHRISIVETCVFYTEKFGFESQLPASVSTHMVAEELCY